MPLNVKGINKLGAETLKYLGKNKTIAGALGIGNAKASSKLGRFAQKSARFTTKTGLIGGTLGAAGSFLPDGGPDENDMAERAYNQLRYGADMTDAQMEEAIGKGQQFQDTGIIGENGLNEEQVRAYIAQESRDKLGEQNWYSSAAKKGLGAVEWLGGLIGGSVATGTNAYFDKQLGGARNQELQNIVTKLKQDHNERKIRADREGTMGKAMTEGLLGSEFGSGRVTGIGGRGGIKPPANPQEAEALRQYNKIKAEKGVGYAIKSEYAKLAGRQVYEDINDLIPSEGVDPAFRRSAMENLLQQAGIMDADTYMENATGKTLTEMNAAQAEVNKTAAAQAAEAAAKQTAAEQAQAQEKKSGPVNLTPASTPEQVKNNIATIAASRSYYGEPDVASQQREYFRKRGVSTSADLNERLEAAADKAYADANNGMSRHSSDAINALYRRHGERLEQSKRQYIENRKRMADIEYDKYIVKPGDPNYKLSPPVTASTPDEMAQADRDSAASMGDGSLPAQVNQSANTPGIPSNIAPPRPNPGLIPPTVRPTVPPATAPTAMSPTPYGIGTANRGSGLPSFSPPRLPSNVMKPTPYGLGTATPGMPQVPDIGAPVRNAVENALTRRSGGPANVMAPTPYGLGTATPGVPQVPDIGAPARAFGEKVAGGVMDMYGRIQAINPFAQGTAGHTGWNYANTMGGGPAGSERRQLENAAGEQRFQAEEALNGGPANRPLSPSEIAKMLAEDKLKEEQRVKGMKMPSKSGPTPRFYHPTQGPNNRPY